MGQDQLKGLLKRAFPEFVRTVIRNRRSRFRGQTMERVFSGIYAEGYWQDDSLTPVSGPGSTPIATQELRLGLQAFIEQRHCGRIVDLGCGDFTWVSEMDLGGIQYVGYDIVPDLIEKNRRLFGNEERRFEIADISEAPIGDCDLVICRDCLVHLAFHEIQAVLENIRASGAQFMALTHFPSIPRNIDISTGQWRPLNLTLPPFGCRVPETSIGDNLNQDRMERVLGIWESSCR